MVSRGVEGCRGVSSWHGVLRCRVGVEVWCRGVEARAQPLLSRLLPPLGATPPSSRRILAPRVYQATPRARTTLLTPTPIICRQVMSLLRSTLVSDTCTSTDDVGAGVPFGCIVTADDGITTGVSSSSESSSPASSRSALRSAWLTLHAVNRRPQNRYSLSVGKP